MGTTCESAAQAVRHVRVIAVHTTARSILPPDSTDERPELVAFGDTSQPRPSASAYSTSAAMPIPGSPGSHRPLRESTSEPLGRWVSGDWTEGRLTDDCRTGPGAERGAPGCCSLLA